MAQYGVAEAKNNFTHLLDCVEKGETVTITRHGKPVAELRAPAAQGRNAWTPEERREAYDAFVRRREAGLDLGVSAADLIRQMRDEGF